ncbi:spore germination protein [Paenibacillus sp. KQZ6P-2]|uniref:Spore germination protein n=1 Tax=Paenibacillus mangrovi TaxID=2931978 RepID=A0A9X1WQT0_9BACL|nr:GerAB/ArcD/ProY family transporter [Paenibacillus mangrovi]MCJ8013672.1 spore germination protein [Paenibacillus mangrovi]
MAQDEKFMSPKQQFLFIIQAQIGVGVLSIPYKLSETAKGGGGISVIMAGIITQIIILMMWALMRKFPGRNLFQICLQLAGPIVGRMLIICYIGYFLFLGANIMLSAIEVLSRWILQETPKWVLLGLFSIMTFYLAREKLTVLARFYSLASGLFIPLIIFVSYGLTQAHIEYMFPIMETGFWNILRGTKDTTNSMYGFEVFLIIFPFIDASDKQKLFIISMSNLFVTLFYTFVVCTCLMVFTSDQLRIIPEPVIYLVKSLNFYIFDRADIIFLSIWSITLVCSIVSYCYSASIGLSVLFKQKNHRSFAPYVQIAIYFIALLPITPITIHHFDQMAEFAAYLFIATIPAVLMIVSLFVKRKAGRTV